MAIFSILLYFSFKSPWSIWLLLSCYFKSKWCTFTVDVILLFCYCLSRFLKHRAPDLVRFSSLIVKTVTMLLPFPLSLLWHYFSFCWFKLLVMILFFGSSCVSLSLAICSNGISMLPLWVNRASFLLSKFQIHLPYETFLCLIDFKVNCSLFACSFLY